MATQLETMTQINDAMKAEPGYLFMTESASKTLVKKGFAEVNENIEDDKCQFATRLNAAGIEFLNSNIQAAAPIVKVSAMTSFAIKTAPIPESAKRVGGSGRPSKYPFEALEVGQYFFVPCTEKQPDPAKSLGSVVTSANLKYATPSATETRKNRKGETVPKMDYARKFVLRPYSELDESGERVHGAGVWRTL